MLAAARSDLQFLSGRRLLWLPPRLSSGPPQESMIQDNSLFRLIMGLEQYMCQRGDFLAEGMGTCPYPIYPIPSKSCLSLSYNSQSMMIQVT